MSIPRVQEPLGKPEPYIIPTLGGEIMTIPGTKSCIRVLASAKETEGLISVFGMGAAAGDPAGFHYHKEAHDIFMCTKGKMKVWAGDQCRELLPGDFASVPPGIIHCPQSTDPYDESIGFVTPGGWLDFFRFISERTDSDVIVDEFDKRNGMEYLMPKFEEIKANYDVHFVPGHKGAELQEWSDKDTKIPGGVEAYYLQANKGPTYLLGGIMSRPFITTKQSGGKFAITSIESSSKLQDSILTKGFSFPKAHQVYHVLDGAIVLKFNRQDNMVRAGETVLIPAGKTVSLHFIDNYVRFWSFSSGDGLETLVSDAGEAYKGKLVPNKAGEADASEIASVAEKIGMKLAS